MSSAHTLSAGAGSPDAIRRYFEVALYLMVLTGFGTLAATSALGPITVALVAGALVFRGYLLLRQRALVIPESWTNSLTLGYVAFYLADYFLISGGFLNATIHLVLFVMVVRLFSLRRDRDFYFLSVICFLMVLAAALLTVDSIFVAAFAAFLLTAVATFILMEMRRASSLATVHCREWMDEAASRRMAASLAGASPVIVLLILLGAAAIFFVLPRISTGYLHAYAIRNELASGFSDRVELGQIGEIQQSQSVVMHIQIDGDTAGAFNLKWRGVALNVFDGRVWSNPHEPHATPRLPDGRFLLLPPDVRPQFPLLATGHPIHYQVLMEPEETNIFFLAARPQVLEGNYRQVWIDGGGAVFDIDARSPVSRYQAWSDIAQPSPTELRAASGPYPPKVVNDYLQLPALDSRIPRLAQQIAAPAKNNYDKATAIEDYLLTHFGYTLQLSRSTPRDPLAEFLFERKQGHCEYFASSMAVMLRTLGIPSRVVDGFRTGEFNDLTSQYVVRDSNAHSWVEAYFPGYGWVSFDPTPAGPGQAHTAWSRAMLYVDAMESFWREWVVNYDASHQLALGEDAARASHRWLRRLQSWEGRRYQALIGAMRRAHSTVVDSPLRWSLLGLAAAGLLLALANGRRVWQAMQRRRLAGQPEKSPRLSAEIWYERMTGVLARKGWRKPSAQTPSEFVGSIDEDAIREPVAQFTRHYEWARFGGSVQDARQLPELYQRVARSIHR